MRMVAPASIDTNASRQLRDKVGVRGDSVRLHKRAEMILSQKDQYRTH